MRDELGRRNDGRLSAVTYVGLPISSGGAHSLRRIDRRVAHERTTAFVGTCTELVAPPEYSFAVHDVPELPPEPSFDRELRRRFGKAEVVEEHRVSDALDFLDEIDPQPTNRWGMEPIWFSESFDFRILDPSGRHPLPGQVRERFHGAEYEWGVPLGSSHLRLILNNGASIAIELCIPDADDALLNRMIPWLQRHLPFKFSPKQWRAWTATKSGSFKSRRLDVSAQLRPDRDLVSP